MGEGRGRLQDICKEAAPFCHIAASLLPNPGMFAQPFTQKGQSELFPLRKKAASTPSFLSMLLCQKYRGKRGEIPPGNPLQHHPTAAGVSQDPNSLLTTTTAALATRTPRLLSNSGTEGLSLDISSWNSLVNHKNCFCAKLKLPKLKL